MKESPVTAKMIYLTCCMLMLFSARLAGQPDSAERGNFTTVLAKANAADRPADSVSGEDTVRLWIRQSERVGNVVRLFVQNRQRDTIIMLSSFYVDDFRKHSHVLVYGCGWRKDYDSTYCDWYSAPLEAEPLEFSGGKLWMPPGKTFYFEIPVWDMYIGHEVYLKPQLWFLRNEKEILCIVTKETNRIYLKRLSVLPRDSRHVALFEHVYRNNNADNRAFQQQVYSTLGKGVTLPVSYSSMMYNEWVNAWQLCIASSLEISRGVFAKIQKAGAGERIGSMALRKNGVYVGTFYVDSTAYPVAVYSEKDTVDKLTKVQVSSIEALEKPANRRYLLYDKYVAREYVIIAFYEEGVSEPALIIQVEKPANRSQQSTVEAWLRFLNILQAPEGG
jgi:hypothetical protein